MPKMKLSILNVGHGDFIYCETPLNNRLIIDCGSSDDVIPSAFLSKINTIDELQISHPHTDHFHDISDIAKKTIRSFRCPALSFFTDKEIGWKKSDAEKIKALRKLEESTKPVDSAVACDASFQHAVWTSQISYNGDPNRSSLVTLLAYNGFKVLLGGDLPEEGWLNLLKTASFQENSSNIDVFKIAHHGRENAYCKELIDFIKPKIGIISDKALDKDNENTSFTEGYSASIKANGGGINFYKTSDGSFVGTRYVLTTRSDNSIFISAESKSTYLIRTCTRWLSD